jgi:hypothetical protein
MTRVKRNRSLPRRRGAGRGQALTEFALVIGLFVLVVGALIQFALILWSMNTLTQVVRETARWAATQSVVPCDGTPSRNAVAAKADSIARGLSLMAYNSGSWTTAGPVASTPEDGVGADWRGIPPDPTTVLFNTDCPPTDSQTAWFVKIQIRHPIPIFMPGLQFVLPPCSSGYCMTSTAEIRMEPKAP